jgi:ankyrin repeat protein
LFSVVFLKQSNICLSLPASTILFCRSADGTTPLHVAATWGDSASLHFLLLNGGDPCHSFFTFYSIWRCIAVVNKPTVLKNNIAA